MDDEKWNKQAEIDAAVSKKSLFRRFWEGFGRFLRKFFQPWF